MAIRRIKPGSDIELLDDPVQQTLTVRVADGRFARASRDAILALIPDSASELLDPDLAARIALLDTPITGLVDKVAGLQETYGSTAAAADSATAAIDAQAAAELAKAAAQAAQGGAADYAASASTSKTAAETAASSASSSAATAVGSATSASGSAGSAATSAVNAADAATAAGGSATASSGSASAAAASAGDAGGSAAAANTAKVAAETAATGAATSADAAATSASTASASQTSAGTYAAAADTSATSASTHAANALTYRDDASSAATSAAGSASAAASTLTSISAAVGTAASAAVEALASAQASDIAGLKAQYTLKVQAVRPDGKVVMGYLGLSSTANNAYSQSEIILGAGKLTFVLDDDPNGTPQPLLTTGTRNGVGALIVRNAFIGDLAVDTLQIAGNAVTVPVGAELLSDTIFRYIGGANNEVAVLATSANSGGAPLFVIACYDLYMAVGSETSYPAAGDGTIVRLYVGGVLQRTTFCAYDVASNAYSSFHSGVIFKWIASPGAGALNVVLTMQMAGSGGGDLLAVAGAATPTRQGTAFFALGTKR